MRLGARLKGRFLFLLFLGFWVSFPTPVLADTTPTLIIEEAKFAIEQARKAGADTLALDEYAAAQSWLSQAEKEYQARKSFFARTRNIVTSDKAKEEEIIYLGSMAKLKALTAEARAKKNAISIQLKDSQRERADYQTAVEVMKSKVAEAEKAKQVQARAEEERKKLEEARRETAELEARKRRELEEAQRRAEELEAVKKKDLQASRLEEATRLAKRERELAEEKLKAERMAALQAQRAAELQAREEKLAAEREKLAAEREKIAALQKRAEALEQEKAMLAEAGKIPRVRVGSKDREVVITILAINLFTPDMEMTPSGKEILDRVGDFLNQYPDYRAVVRGHTDSIGSEAINKKVSEKRAQRVKEYLVEVRNVNPARMESEGLGPSQPVATNATETGRALNRRVEIAVRGEE